MIRVEGTSVLVETRTLVARFDRGALVGLKRRADGRVLLESEPDPASPLQLIYPGQETVALTGELGDQTLCLPPNDRCAEIRLTAWNGDGVLMVSEDLEAGDLVVEPSGCASRPGLRGCRWNLAVTIRDAAQHENPNPAIAELLALGAAT